MVITAQETELKPGYKQTEVGVIPEDWYVQAFSDVCLKIQDGTHFSPKLGGNDYRYITSRNIRFGFLYISDVDWIDAAEHKSIYKRCDVKYGDLLLTKDGANTGNAALNNLDEEFSLLSSVAFLRFNSKRHVARYFLQQILSTFGQQQIKEAMSGNAITRLTLEKIKQLRFPVPAFPEQTAIANILSDTDSLITSLDRLIAKKRDIKQATMQQLLTEKTRLPGFGGEWKVRKLGEIADVTKLAGFEYTNYFNGYKDGGEIIVIRGTNITNNRLDLSDVRTIPIETSKKLQRSKLKRNDLVFAYVGTIGPVYLIEENDKYHLGPNTSKITTNNETSPQYLYHYFTSSLIENEKIYSFCTANKVRTIRHRHRPFRYGR
jgi:type I restriction enzyme, S subunit